MLPLDEGEWVYWQILLMVLEQRESMDVIWFQSHPLISVLSYFYLSPRVSNPVYFRNLE